MFSLPKQAAPWVLSPSPHGKGNPYTTWATPFSSPCSAASNTHLVPTRRFLSLLKENHPRGTRFLPAKKFTQLPKGGTFRPNAQELLEGNPMHFGPVDPSMWEACKECSPRFLTSPPSPWGTCVS
jgi:hypothetical protein